METIRVLILRLFLVLFVRTFATVFCRHQMTGRENLPRKGPAILVANHDSHLDTFLIWLLLEWRTMDTFRPLGSRQYLRSNWLLSFFSGSILRVIYINREIGSLLAVRKVLRQGSLVLIYPEGTRGEPGVMKEFEPGVGLLTTWVPEATVIPISLTGTGTVLPKGALLPRLGRCHVVIGRPVTFTSSDSRTRTKELEDIVRTLRG